MDARPQRPRNFQIFGEENVPPPANATGHVRNKSIGTSIIMGGMKDNTKRAAFADLSNISKNPITLTQNGHKKNAKSENGVIEIVATGKDAFRRPAQRPTKPLTSLSNISRIVPLNTENVARKDSKQQEAKPVASMKAGLQVFNDGVRVHDFSVQPAVPAMPLSTTGPAALRRYKSQPQLKPQAPTLRRTQSRVLDTSSGRQTESLPVMSDLTEALYEDALEHIYEPSRETQCDALSGGVSLTVDNKDELLPAASVGAFASSHDERPAGLSATILSEPEEYWDDEEEDEVYDDQGYTTAHSFRSKGDLTTGGLTALLQPKVTNKVLHELEAAKAFVEANRTQIEIEEDMWDVSMVAEYGEEIFEYMRELEERLLPNPHYMDIQTEIQWSMRSVLMDWLVQVHGRFGLLPETLYTAVNYIDRFLSRKVVSLGKLQLVGATAILVAAKYEEINCPSLQEIVYMVDKGYTMEEVMKAERFMLSMLDYELGWPGPMSFLRRISKADDYDLDTRTLAKYFLEVTIMDERFVGSPCSFLAAGAHCLSRLMLRKGHWSLAHVHYSGYTLNQLKPLISLILDCCQVPLQHHAAVFEKYNDRRCRYCSQYVQDELSTGFDLEREFQQCAPVSYPYPQFNGRYVDGSDRYANNRQYSIPLPAEV